MDKKAKHIIFKSEKEAVAAQKTVFERLQELVDLPANTKAYDLIVQFAEGYGFANPYVSIYRENAEAMLTGVEGEFIDATIPDYGA
jgi:hypothetical protein